MTQEQKMITLFKGLLLDDYTIEEYVNNVVVKNPNGERSFTITHQQLELLKKKILLSKLSQPTRNIYRLMPITPQMN
jgi:hypothetical protein